MTDSVLFKEKETDYIYEAQLFDDYVLIRPASPDFVGHIENLSYDEFDNRFTEFWGHPDQYLAVAVSVARH